MAAPSKNYPLVVEKGKGKEDKVCLADLESMCAFGLTTKQF